MINDGELISPGICEIINDMLDKALFANKANFCWTSLQVNHNTVASWHQDLSNLGKSAIVIGGDFEGGAFEVWNCPLGETNGMMTFFQGQQWHRSHAFMGHRVSICVYVRAF